MPSFSDSKSFKIQSFGAEQSQQAKPVKPNVPQKQKKIVTPEEYKHDAIVRNNPITRFKVDLEKTANIPLVHFPRGLGGAPDYTFFEFLQTANFPYYVGGPVLAALFYAGVKFDNFQSAKAAKKVAKHMALGVGLYYLGAMAAKSVINTTVKLSRGIDLSQPYRKVIPTSTNHTGAFQKDVEYHKVFESIDFTRWDLLYENGKDTQGINKKYNKLAKKYGLRDENPNDADTTLKPLIRKTIAMGRAWQYALTALFVSMGIGMANQKAWDVESTVGFKQHFKKGIFGKNIKFKTRLLNTKNLAMQYALKPLGKSFMQFWKGQNKLTSVVGKTTILTAAAATVLANILILTRTTARYDKTEKTTGNKPKKLQEAKKQ